MKIYTFCEIIKKEVNGYGKFATLIGIKLFAFESLNINLQGSYRFMVDATKIYSLRLTLMREHTRTL